LFTDLFEYCNVFQLQDLSKGSQSEGLQMLSEAIVECSAELNSLVDNKSSNNHFIEIKDMIRQNQQMLTRNQQMLQSLMVPK
jgi:meiotically up-regulated gene 157 (Mug157) protein